MAGESWATKESSLCLFPLVQVYKIRGFATPFTSAAKLVPQ